MLRQYAQSKDVQGVLRLHGGAVCMLSAKQLQIQVHSCPFVHGVPVHSNPKTIQLRHDRPIVRRGGDSLAGAVQVLQVLQGKKGCGCMGGTGM